MVVLLLTSKGNRCQAKNIALVRKRRRAGATGAKTVARRRIDPKTAGIIAAEIEKVIHNSENNHHCARRNLIKKITDVIKMQNHTAPGEMSRPVIAPFPRPSVKSDAAAQPGVFQRRRPLIPVRRNRRFLLRGDLSGGSSASRVISVRIIDLNPMTAVVSSISPVERATTFADDEIHSLRGLVVALHSLLSLALPEADVVLACQTPFLIEAHFIALLIDQNQRLLQLWDEQLAAPGDEGRRLGVPFTYPFLVLAVR